MNIAYIRVSTADQNTERQRTNLAKYNIDRYFEEKVSGKNTDRPELTSLLAYARSGDTVYIDDFSRLARNTKDLLEIIETFEANGVQVISNKERLDTGTPQGKLMLTVMGAIAAFERELLLERQREGIKAAKQSGKYLGGQRKRVPNMEQHYTAYMERRKSKPQLAKELGISRPTLDRLFREHIASVNNSQTLL